MTNGHDGASAAVELLTELARRAAIASRLRSQSESRLLQSILDAAVSLFRAEAASLALANAAGDSLEFTLAAGTKGQGVVGTIIPIAEGIAGFVCQTGEPMALASPVDDARFGRTIAEQTGYVPRSILAVPLLTPERVVGVIEILDCRDGPFTGRDIEVASSFARQAAIAIDASRVEREFPLLIANALAAYDLEMSPEVAAAVASIQHRTQDDFWDLVDSIAALAGGNPRMLTFVRDLLPIVNQHLVESTGPRFVR